MKTSKTVTECDKRYVSLHMSAELHDRLKKLSEIKGRSIRILCLDMIDAALKELEL